MDTKKDFLSITTTAGEKLTINKQHIALVEPNKKDGTTITVKLVENVSYYHVDVKYDDVVRALNYH